MRINFADYLELRNKTCEEDLTLFDEIITCMENEAYRSASILIWISVLESLVRKLNILAQDDHEIREFMDNFKDNKNEKGLLLKCENLNLINQIEYGQLDTIRRARNEYAHPTDNSPTKEEVELYLYFAVEYVLSKPNLYSINVAKKELRNILNDSNFLGNASNQQVVEYASTFTRKISNNYLDEIIKKLFKMIERKYNENNPNNHSCIQHGLIYAKVLILNNLEYLTSENSNYLIDEYKITSCHLFSNHEIWEDLDSRSKERIFNYSKDYEICHITKMEFLNKFYRLYKSEKLDDELKTEYTNILYETSLETLLYCNIPANEYYDKLIEELASRNYYRQNPAAKIIMKTDLSIFNHEQLEQIGRNILQSAEGGANDSERAINKFKIITPPKSFLKGLLFETLINDNYELRIKPKFFEEVITITKNSEYGEELFNEFLDAINKSRPKSLDFNEYNTIIKRLRRFNIQKSEFNSIMSALKESIKNSSNKYVEDIMDNNYPNECKLNLNTYLTEENKDKFKNLAKNDPIKFIRFFSKIKNDGWRKYKIVEMDIDLITQFIEYDELNSEIDKLDYDNLSKLEKQIIECFNQRRK